MAELIPNNKLRYYLVNIGLYLLANIVLWAVFLSAMLFMVEDK